MAAALLALGLVCALLGVLVVGLLRSHADILRALHDLGVGDAQLRGEAPSASRPPQGIRTVPGVAEPSTRSALGRLHDIDGALPDGGVAHIALEDTRWHHAPRVPLHRMHDLSGLLAGLRHR